MSNIPTHGWMSWDDDDDRPDSTLSSNSVAVSTSKKHCCPDDNSAGSTSMKRRNQGRILFPHRNPNAPFIRTASAWTGGFSILQADGSVYQEIGGLLAHLAGKSYPKVWLETGQFRPVLTLDVVPKSHVWPRRFWEWGPGNDNVAVCFLPSKESVQEEYDYLVYELTRDDLTRDDIGANCRAFDF